MIRKQIRLTEQQIAALKAEAQETGINMTELIRRIIDEHTKARPQEGGVKRS